MSLTFLAAAILPVMLIAAAIFDATSYIIPNRIVLVLLAAFPVAALAAGLPLAAVGLHLAAGLIVFAVTFLLFAVGGFGAGDAKLASVTALWLGLSPLLPFALLTAVAGGLLALMILMLRRFLTPFAVGGVGWIARLADPTERHIPYGIAIAAGGLLALRHSVWAPLFGL